VVSVAVKGSGNPFGSSDKKHHSILNSAGVSRGNRVSGPRDVAPHPHSLPVPPLVAHVPYIYGGPAVGKEPN